MRDGPWDMAEERLRVDVRRFQMGIDEMKKAVINMDARAHQIPAPTG
jgi:hypothetical protein